MRVHALNAITGSPILTHWGYFVFKLAFVSCFLLKITFSIVSEEMTKLDASGTVPTI